MREQRLVVSPTFGDITDAVDWINSKCRKHKLTCVHERSASIQVRQANGALLFEGATKAETYTWLKGFARGLVWANTLKEGTSEEAH